MTDDDTKAYLHWGHATPCFCDPCIEWDHSKLQATPETIAAIFGLEDVESIQLSLQNSDDEPLALQSYQDHPYWILEAGQHYTVTSISPLPDDGLTPIHQIFTLLPGTTDNERGDRLEGLSNNFYHKIWHSPDTPTKFRDKFFSKFSSETIQAFRQYDWLHEVLGGPKYDEMGGATRINALKPKVMAKHTSSRMSLEYAITWLELMNRSMLEEFPDEPKLRHALGMYWLHFYAFFPYSEDERKQIRKVALQQHEENETA